MDRTGQNALSKYHSQEQKIEQMYCQSLRAYSIAALMRAPVHDGQDSGMNRADFPGGSILLEHGVMGTTSKRYSAEVRERAVRMVAEHRDQYGSQWAAIESIAGKLTVRRRRCGIGCDRPSVMKAR
jgi:hypothetical protein